MSSAIHAMRRPCRAFLLLALLPLVACSGGLHSKEPQIVSYVLSTPQDSDSGAAPATSHAATGPAILVLEPVVAPGLASDGIALLTADGRLDRYASSRWADDLPRVVSDLVVHTLRAAPAIASVSDSAAPFAAGYVLRVDVTHFEARYPGTRADGAQAPKISVQFACTLARRDDRVVIANFTAAAEQNAGENRMASVIAAFDAATRAALVELRQKTLAALAAAP